MKKVIATINKQRAVILSVIIMLAFLCQADVLQIGSIYLEYSGRDAKIAAKLGNKLSENISQFQKKIGHYPELKTHLIICADKADYQARINQSSAIMEFSQAHYNPRSKQIIIRNPRDGLNYRELNKVVFHEYLHHFVFHYFVNAPLWFHEGMAVYFSNDFGQGRELNLAAQYFMNNTLPLSEMNIYPANRIEWESFYANSALAVKYLVTKRKRGFYRLWEIAEPQRKFNSAFHRSFYQTVKTFSHNYAEYQSNHFKSMIFILLSSMVWMIFPFLFFISVIKHKYRERKLLRKMEAADAQQPEIIEIEFDIEKTEN